MYFSCLSHTLHVPPTLILSPKYCIWWRVYITNCLIITYLESPVAAPMLSPTLVLSALRQKFPIFWDVIPCTLVNMCQSLGGGCCIYLRSLDCRTVFYTNK
jgi:hypothetical protein